jgi:hypothetical protein
LSHALFICSSGGWRSPNPTRTISASVSSLVNLQPRPQLATLHSSCAIAVLTGVASPWPNGGARRARWTQCCHSIRQAEWRQKTGRRRPTLGTARSKPAGQICLSTSAKWCRFCLPEYPPSARFSPSPASAKLLPEPAWRDRYGRAIHAPRESFSPLHSKATGEVGLRTLSMAAVPLRFRACRC